MSGRCHKAFLWGALIFFAGAALAALSVYRQHRQLSVRAADRHRLLETLKPDILRVMRYEALESALRDAQDGRFAMPSQPAGLPAPDKRDVRRLPVVGGWRGVQTEMSWQQVQTEKALSLASYYATNLPYWRVSELRIETLDAPGSSRLNLLLESATPAADEPHAKP